MAINFNQSSLLMLIQLINEENNTDVPANALVVGLPSVLGGPRNTQVTVSAVAETAYNGGVIFTYNRLNLQSFFNGPIPIVSSSILTTSDILPFINSQFNVQLSNSDIVVGAVSNATVMLTAHANSLAWLGSVEINISAPTQALADIWTKTALDGFVF